MAQRRLETDTEDELHAPCQALITKLEKRVKELEDQRDRVHKTLAVGEVGGGTTNFATRSFDEQDAFQVPYKLQEKFLRTLCNDDTMPLWQNGIGDLKAVAEALEGNARLSKSYKDAIRANWKRLEPEIVKLAIDNGIDGKKINLRFMDVMIKKTKEPRDNLAHGGFPLLPVPALKQSASVVLDGDVEMIKWFSFLLGVNQLITKERKEESVYSMKQKQ